jgi:hypothetical protein
MKQKFALPDTPTHFAEVRAQGRELRGVIGVAAEQPSFSGAPKGGGLQVQLDSGDVKPYIFGPGRPIADISR